MKTKFLRRGAEVGVFEVEAIVDALPFPWTLGMLCCCEVVLAKVSASSLCIFGSCPCGKESWKSEDIMVCLELDGFAVVSDLSGCDVAEAAIVPHSERIMVTMANSTFHMQCNFE